MTTEVAAYLLRYPGAVGTKLRPRNERRSVKVIDESSAHVALEKISP
jgi:hypothetical protein